jgi:cation transport regulator ChaB
MTFINIFKSTEEIKSIIKVSEAKLPKSLQAIYRPNFGTFDNWLKNNREHQEIAYERVTEATKLGWNSQG